MRVTIAFILLNIVSIFLNVIVGLALALAEWDERYSHLGLFSLTCWGIIMLFQVKLFVKYVKQFLIKGD